MPPLEPKLEAMLTEMEHRMTGTRRRARGTLLTYMNTSKRFLAWLGREPVASDVDAYFSYRRKEDISESTLKKEFIHLRKLFVTNHLNWPFIKEDVPHIDTAPFAPALMPVQIERLISSQQKYSDCERFYLAVSTIFGCRREELLRIKSRDIQQDTMVLTSPWTISLNIAKQKKPVTIKHIIPDSLRPIFEVYTPKEHTGQGMSNIFKRICKKAGVRVGTGWGWHAIRRTLDTVMIEVVLPENNMPSHLWPEYVGWSKTKIGGQFFNSTMAGHYIHTEILGSDPYRVDHLLHPILPTLKWWDKALKAH